MVEIQGSWAGHYTFGEEYGEWGDDQQVPFQMTIESVNNEFVGRIYEDPATGGLDDDLIMLRGNQRGDEIAFVKFYSKEHITLENYEIISIESNHAHTVHYEGAYDIVEKKFKGIWFIPVMEMDDEGVFREGLAGTGQWVAWREG